MFLVKPRKKRKVTALVRKLHKTGSILPEQIAAYRKQTQAFRAKFGREMRPDDPFFFGSECGYAAISQCARCRVRSESAGGDDDRSGSGSGCGVCV